jgi:hypothetical protein
MAGKRLEVVFATDTAALPLRGGNPVTVYKGSHWPADDPVVQQHPGMFADDPRYGLSFTVVPAEMGLAPDGEPLTDGEDQAQRRRGRGKEETSG